MRSTDKPMTPYNDPAEERKQADLQREKDFKDLEQMEQTIRSGIEAFVTVGRCLAEIHERKLYKLRGFSNFSEYCEIQFKISRAHGYRQITHVAMCQTIGEDPSEVSERATRPLVKLQDTATIKKIWQEAKSANGGKMPSSGVVNQHVKNYHHNLKLKKEMLTLSDQETVVSSNSAQSGSSTIFQEMYGGSSPSAAAPPATIYCNTLKCELPVNDIAKALIAEAAKLAQADEATTADQRLLNQSDKLSSAAYELRSQLLPSQRNDIKAEYQRLAGELFDAWLAAPAETDNVTSDPGTGSAPERS